MKANGAAKYTYRDTPYPLGTHTLCIAVHIIRCACWMHCNEKEGIITQDNTPWLDHSAVYYWFYAGGDLGSVRLLAKKNCGLAASFGAVGYH